MRAGLIVVAVLLAVTLAGTASADWLVLRDGGAIQTDGSWTVKGKLVVFHRADGSLSSLRLDAVDLEASERQTAAAKAPRPRADAEAAAEPEVEPVLVLTDADVTHVDPRTLADGATGEEPEEAPEQTGEGEDSEVTAAGALRVVSWTRVDDIDFTGIKIGGTIRNNSTEVALNPQLTVRLSDEGGLVIGRSRAVLQSKGLEPGASTSFEAEFSGVYEYFGVEFDPRSFDAVRRSAVVEPGEVDGSDSP